MSGHRRRRVRATVAFRYRREIEPPGGATGFTIYRPIRFNSESVARIRFTASRQSETAPLTVAHSRRHVNHPGTGRREAEPRRLETARRHDGRARVSTDAIAIFLSSSRPSTVSTQPPRPHTGSRTSSSARTRRDRHHIARRARSTIFPGDLPVVD